MGIAVAMEMFGDSKLTSSRLLVPEHWPEAGNLNWRYHNWRDSQTYTQWHNEKQLVINRHLDNEKKAKQFVPPKTRFANIEDVELLKSNMVCLQTDMQRLVKEMDHLQREISRLQHRPVANLAAPRRIIAPIAPPAPDVVTQNALTGGEDAWNNAIHVDDEMSFATAEDFNKFYQELHKY